MTIRNLPLKKRLAKAMRRSWPVPTWVIAKTHGRVRFHAKQRHWRRGRLKA